jgi:hypothetical protein
MSFPEFPAWRYGPNGASVIVNSEDETPKGYVDHPSKVKDAADQSGSGTKTARAPAGSTASAAQAAKTTEAKSQTATDPKVAAKSGVPGAAASSSEDVDAAGTKFDPALHAATKSKTKAGLWRMKVGVARPEPLDL